MAENEQEDDVFTAGLVAYDAALANGTPHCDETPDNEELKRAKACLEQLAAVCPPLARNSSFVSLLHEAAPTATPAIKLTEPHPRIRLGRFEILRELGRGGG